ncbi:MAG: hypothetical protein IJ111_02775 [Eggerthellaceae bacterium]|nr:hypothetical protein [Eggerthellaceae bacterium]
MAIDITSIINQHVNAALQDASIVDKLHPSSTELTEKRPRIMGALL